MVFTEEVAFAKESPDEGREAWNELTHNSDIGQVYVPDPGRFGIPPSKLSSDIAGYSLYPVALYHQRGLRSRIGCETCANCYIAPV